MNLFKKYSFAVLCATAHAMPLVADFPSPAYAADIVIRSTDAKAIAYCKKKIKREQQMMKALRYAIVGGLSVYVVYSYFGQEKPAAAPAVNTMTDQDFLAFLKTKFAAPASQSPQSRMQRVGGWLKDTGKGLFNEVKHGVLLAAGYSLYDRIFNTGDILWFAEKRTKVDQHLAALQEFAQLYEYYKERAHNSVELEEGCRQIAALCSTLVGEFELLLGFMQHQVDGYEGTPAARRLAHGIVEDFRARVDNLLATTVAILHQKSAPEQSLKKLIKQFTVEYYKPLLASFARF